jgi:hypothetical protein
VYSWEEKRRWAWLCVPLFACDCGFRYRHVAIAAKSDPSGPVAKRNAFQCLNMIAFFPQAPTLWCSVLP